MHRNPFVTKLGNYASHNTMERLGNATNWEAKSQFGNFVLNLMIRPSRCFHWRTLPHSCRPTRTRMSSASTATPNSSSRWWEIIEEQKKEDYCAWLTAPQVVGLWNSSHPEQSGRGTAAQSQSWTTASRRDNTAVGSIRLQIRPSILHFLPGKCLMSAFIFQLGNMCQQVLNWARCRRLQMERRWEGLHHSKLVSIATHFTGMLKNEKKGLFFFLQVVLVNACRILRIPRSQWRKEATQVNKQKTFSQPFSRLAWFCKIMLHCRFLAAALQGRKKKKSLSVFAMETCKFFWNVFPQGLCVTWIPGKDAAGCRETFRLGTSWRHLSSSHGLRWMKREKKKRWCPVFLHWSVTLK